METINDFLEDPVVSKLIAAIAGLLVIGLIVSLVKRITTRYVKESSSKYYLRKTANFTGYLIMILYISVIYSEKLGGLTVALGVAGAGIAFALQEVIVSFAGWLAILFAKLYRNGDRVQLGGIKGDVMDIGVLRTTLMEIGQWISGDLYSGRIVQIANSFVFKEPVFNYSTNFPFLWDEIKVPIKTNSDIKFTRSILEGILTAYVDDYTKSSQQAWKQMTDQYMIEDARISPKIFFKFDENWVEFTLRYIVDYKLRGTTRNDLFEKIFEAIKQHPDKIQIASAAFEITAFPTSTSNND